VGGWGATPERVGLSEGLGRSVWDVAKRSRLHLTAPWRNRWLPLVVGGRARAMRFSTRPVLAWQRRLRDEKFKVFEP
jgi:hypothetical protein